MEFHPELGVPEAAVARVAAVIHAPSLDDVHPAAYELLVGLEHEVIEAAPEHGVFWPKNRVVRDVENTIIEGETVENECSARASIVDESGGGGGDAQADRGRRRRL